MLNWQPNRQTVQIRRTGSRPSEAIAPASGPTRSIPCGSVYPASINALLGNVLSSTLWAWSAPVTGRRAVSNSPT